MVTRADSLLARKIVRCRLLNRQTQESTCFSLMSVRADAVGRAQAALDAVRRVLTAAREFCDQHDRLPRRNDEHPTGDGLARKVAAVRRVQLGLLSADEQEQIRAEFEDVLSEETGVRRSLQAGGRRL